MRNDLTDDDVLAFALHGCNDEEIAAYAGTEVKVAKARVDLVLRRYAAQLGTVARAHAFVGEAQA